jgi:hypothetical protein
MVEANGDAKLRRVLSKSTRDEKAAASSLVNPLGRLPLLGIGSDRHFSCNLFSDRH